MMFLGTMMVLMASGCGGKGGDSPAALACGSKALASVWTYSGSTISLVGLTLNQPGVLGIQTAGGEMCSMDILFSGDDCSGVLSIQNSTYTGGGAGDPGCATMNGISTYSKSDSGLNICDPGPANCELWQ